MKEQVLFLTHELIVKDCQLYGINHPKRLINQLQTYDSIENISLTKISGNLYLELYGVRKMYGYKIEDDGFYDLLNNRYYSKYEFERMQIIKLQKVNAQTTRKLRR